MSENPITISVVRSSFYWTAVFRIKLSNTVGFRWGVKVETFSNSDEFCIRKAIAQTHGINHARVHVVDDGTDVVI